MVVNWVQCCYFFVYHLYTGYLLLQPETNHVFRVYCVAAVITIWATFNIISHVKCVTYFYISTLLLLLLY